MSKTSQEATVKMKYTGPKARKTLDLPLGVKNAFEITHQVLFLPQHQMIGAVPAQFVETLLTLPEHYCFADDAARQVYASWLTTSPPPPSPAIPTPRPAAQLPKSTDEGATKTMTSASPRSHPPTLTQFEESL